MLWLEMTGMVTRVSENFLKSNAKMRKVAKSRETKNRLAVGELKKKHCLALDKIKKEMETTLKSKDEEIAQISNERDDFRTKLGDTDKKLTEKASQNEGLLREVNETKKENGKLKQNIEKKTNDIKKIKKEMENEQKSHTKVKADLEETKRKLESDLDFAKSTNLGMKQALAIHTKINLKREEHAAEVEETEENAREAKRYKAHFEQNSAKGVKKVAEAVELLINGQLNHGKRKINEVEKNTADATAALAELRRKRNGKRKQKRTKVPGSREVIREDGNGSALLGGEDEDEDEADGGLGGL